VVREEEEEERGGRQGSQELLMSAWLSSCLETSYQELVSLEHLLTDNCDLSIDRHFVSSLCCTVVPSGHLNKLSGLGYLLFLELEVSLSNQTKFM
jgi:hypothetical protein